MYTREEYARMSFKKKWKFKPINSSGTVGTITDKAGKKYLVIMSVGKSQTYARVNGPRSELSLINLDRTFFQLKGSNRGERRDATLYHEIGHQNLHNINPRNKTVDSRNRSMEVYKSIIQALNNNKRLDVSSDEDIRRIVSSSRLIPRDIRKLAATGNPHDIRKYYYDKMKFAKEYFKTIGTSEERAARNVDLRIAMKFGRRFVNHSNFAEYEADRFAANHISTRAVKREIREYTKIMGTEERIRRHYDKSIADENDPTKRKEMVSKRDREMKRHRIGANDDIQGRYKALRDPDMIKAASYK